MLQWVTIGLQLIFAGAFILVPGTLFSLFVVGLLFLIRRLVRSRLSARLLSTD
jgi:hypothetical protein